MLQIQSLYKRYKNSDRYAIEDVTYDVREGELFGFIGPNGPGKSTTIKCLTGVLPYDRGSVVVCGHDMARDPIRAKSAIGYVSDTHAMYERLTAREYVTFMADMYGVGLNDRRTRTDRLLELFELGSVYDKQISGYSHGMKQKICVIGALVHNPKLWILDEPITGLDPKSSHQLKELMREHCAQGNSVFFSSHILEIVEKLCSRIALIDKGRIQLQGDLESLSQKMADGSLEELFLSVTSRESAQSTDVEPSAPQAQ